MYPMTRGKPGGKASIRTNDFWYWLRQISCCTLPHFCLAEFRHIHCCDVYPLPGQEQSESTAFLGALCALSVQGTPMKVVDLDLFFFLRNTYVKLCMLKESSVNDESQHVITIDSGEYRYIDIWHWDRQKGYIFLSVNR